MASPSTSPSIAHDMQDNNALTFGSSPPVSEDQSSSTYTVNSSPSSSLHSPLNNYQQQHFRMATTASIKDEHHHAAPQPHQRLFSYSDLLTSQASPYEHHGYRNNESNNNGTNNAAGGGLSESNGFNGLGLHPHSRQPLSTMHHHHQQPNMQSSSTMTPPSFMARTGTAAPTTSMGHNSMSSSMLPPPPLSSAVATSQHNHHQQQSSNHMMNMAHQQPAPPSTMALHPLSSPYSPSSPVARPLHQQQQQHRNNSGSSESSLYEGFGYPYTTATMLSGGGANRDKQPRGTSNSPSGNTMLGSLSSSSRPITPVSPLMPLSLDVDDKHHQDMERFNRHPSESRPWDQHHGYTSIGGRSASSGSNATQHPPRSRGRRVSNVPTQGVRMFTCQAEGCGKVFKRSEHLKRHIRSIHTLEKRKYYILMQNGNRTLSLIRSYFVCHSI